MTTSRMAEMLILFLANGEIFSVLLWAFSPLFSRSKASFPFTHAVVDFGGLAVSEVAVTLGKHRSVAFRPAG
jgi:hypothetical protein